MSKGMISFSSISNEHNKTHGASRRVGRLIWMAILIGAGPDLFAQRQGACDALESAWLFYHEVYFENAKALIAHCEEVRAFELRACIAFKEGKASLADTLLCKLLARAKDYEFDPKHLPPGLIARAEKLKKNFHKECEPKLFSLRNPPLLVERDTNMLRLWEVNIGMSSNWGRDEGVKNPIIFYARSNFVELAELEFRTVEIINNTLNDGQAQLPTLAVRTQFPLYRMQAQLPVLSALFRTSIELWDWDSDKRGNMKFQKKLKEVRLFLSSFDYWRTFEFHAGVTLSRLKTCVYEGAQDTLCVESGNKLNHFAALQWRANKNALFMMAWETIPEYKFNDNKPEKPATQQVITINLRAFPAQWLAFDLGGIWYRDVRNYHLSLGTTLGFSLQRLFKRML